MPKRVPQRVVLRTEQRQDSVSIGRREERHADNYRN
jgi:hypothetical protein